MCEGRAQTQHEERKKNRYGSRMREEERTGPEDNYGKGGETTFRSGNP